MAMAMGSKRGATAYAPILRLLVSLAALSLRCLCWAPVAMADWGTVYCKTSDSSLDVATARSSIQAYQDCIFGKKGSCTDACCQTNAFKSQCTTFWTAGDKNFAMCGSLRCDDCAWMTNQWLKVVDTCTQNYDGVDRAAGFVSYDWSPGIWNSYGF